MNNKQKERFHKIWDYEKLTFLKDLLINLVKHNCSRLNQKDFLLFFDTFKLFKKELDHCVLFLFSKYFGNMEENEIQIIYKKDGTQVDYDETFEIDKESIFKKDPIKWLGTQKEFAELILELQQKNWIKNESNTSIADTAREFATHFDISQTKKYKKSNEINSLYQLLKPQQSRQLYYEKNYPQIYSKRYIAKFKEIKERKKK